MREERVHIGRILKNARVEKGFSLEKASKDTRITQIYLRSIEEGRFSKIPGDTVLRGFLKIYSDYLGLDPAPLLAELSKRQKSEKKHEPVEIKVEEKEQVQVDVKNILKIACPAAMSLLIVVLLISSIVICAGYVKDIVDYQKNQSSVVLNENKDLEINAEIIDSTWVLVQADGKNIFSGMLHAGARKTWKGKDRIFMKIGNAAGIRITSGERVLFHPGRAGDVVTKEFVK